MKKHIFAFIIVILAVFYTTQIFCMENSELSFKPVSHASFVITAPQHTIYVDPVGSIKSFEAFPKPDMILITDIHRDHLDAAIIKALSNGKTEIIGPKAVIKSLAYGTALDNGDSIIVDNIQIQAIPMYNTTQDRLKFHPKGRGNGYLLTLDQKRIYISGDTEDIPEMRRLKDIDYAFVCMNLPYTMTVEQAASAVLEMSPGIVFPYHYRGKNGFSDIEKFKTIVEKTDKIRVKLLNWYD